MLAMPLLKHNIEDIYWDERYSARLQDSKIFCNHFARSSCKYNVHCHPGVEFILCLSGQGAFLANGEYLPYKAPAIVHHNGDLPHGIDVGNFYEHWNICIDPEMLFGRPVDADRHITNPDFFCPVGIGIINIDSMYSGRLATLFEDISYETAKRLIYHEEILYHQLEELLLLFKRLFNYSAGSDAPISAKLDTLRKPAIDIMTYIDTNLSCRLDASMLADTFNYSKQHIYRLVRQVTGGSLQDYLKKQRVERAKGLLETTNMPINAIADTVGMPDAAYFSRLFRKMTCMTPRQYRMAHQAFSRK